MKTALVMNKNSYAGRAYMDAIVKKGLSVDVIEIGNRPEVDLNEEKRCGGQFAPPLLCDLSIKGDIMGFESLKCEKLFDVLKEKNMIYVFRVVLE